MLSLDPRRVQAHLNPQEKEKDEERRRMIEAARDEERRERKEVEVEAHARLKQLAEEEAAARQEDQSREAKQHHARLEARKKLREDEMTSRDEYFEEKPQET